MLRSFPALLALLFFWGFSAFGQAPYQQRSQNRPGNDSVSYRYGYRDSAALVRYQAKKDSIRAAKDSVLKYQDSVRMVWLKPPKADRPSPFIDSLVRLYTVKNLDFISWSRQFPKKISYFGEGKLRAKGEVWVFIMVILLILSFSLLNRAFSKEIQTIIEAFYNSRAGKEDSVFSSWPFLFMYILFGFTTGMFLYLCARYFQVSYTYTGIQGFLALSAGVVILFSIKVVALKALAFLFDIQWMVKEYVSILYLSYFNAALLLLPLVVAFSLSPLRFAHVYIYAALLVLVFVFGMQLWRIVTNILAKHKFSKTYLFIYLCALEVCPLLVLIKALRF